ncbi:MAG: glycosyltransferase family 4 protein [Pseudomonadota bacterium]
MHVALLTWSDPFADGPVSGLARAAGEIAFGLQGNGVHVSVFSAERTNDAWQHVGPRVEVRGLARHLATGSRKFWRDRAAVGHHVAPRAFAEAVGERHATHPFDVIEATNWYAPAAALKLRGVPLVIRHSTPAIDAINATQALRDRLDLRYASRLERLTAARAIAHISNSRSHRERIARQYRLRRSDIHEVIGLSLDYAFIARGKQAAYPPLDATPELLFVGRAEDRKGFSPLIRALAAMFERRTRAGSETPRLHLVGPAVEDALSVIARYEIDPAILAHVHFHGAIGDDQLEALYQQCHLVVAPSRYESYGLVYREAAAFGRPLVASSVDPSARSFVLETGAGVLARTGHHCDLAESIEALLSRPKRMLWHRQRGLTHAASLSRAVLGARTLEIYQRAMAASRPLAARQRMNYAASLPSEGPLAGYLMVGEADTAFPVSKADIGRRSARSRPPS